MGKLIREEREKRGLSQVVVARRLRYPQPWVSRLENGRRRVDVPELLTIAKAIGFSAWRLVRALEKIR